MSQLQALGVESADLHPLSCCHLFTSCTYIPDIEMCSVASFGLLWQNQAVVTHFKGT